MSRAPRLMNLIALLAARRTPVRARDLATALGVSERSIYRDIDSLRGLGLAIDAVPGVGLRLSDDALLPPLNLDADEWSAVLLGLALVEKRDAAGLGEIAVAARARLRAVIAKEVLEAFDHSGLIAGPTIPGRECAPSLAEAMKAGRKVRIDYRSVAGRHSTRIIWPVAIGIFDGAELLAAWCERRAAWRHFRLDRIGSAVVLDERLPRPRRMLLAEWRRWQSETEE